MKTLDIFKKYESLYNEDLETSDATDTSEIPTDELESQIDAMTSEGEKYLVDLLVKAFLHEPDESGAATAKELQGMVDEIYYDFVSTVSKERKIEIETIVNDIGALIYTTNRADYFHLIDGQLNLDNLIKKTINESDLKNYKVIKLQTSKNSLIKEFLINNLYNNNIYSNNKCLNLRSSMAAILSYETIGC